MIEDAYGTRVLVNTDPAPMVDLEFNHPASTASGGKPSQNFVRLTKEQALELGERLVEVGSE